MKVGIIGDGNVGSSIKRGIENKPGYEVKAVGRDPKMVGELAKWADLLILAVPHSAADAAAKEIGDGARGKTLIDATNALDGKGGLAVAPNTSAAEELQKRIPAAKVVKAFNTVFASFMSSGKVNGEPIALFVAADDSNAKGQVMELGRVIGFQPVDVGPLQNARWLEAMALLLIKTAYGPPNYGPRFGLKVLGL